MWPASPDLGPLVLYGFFRKDYRSLSKERNRSAKHRTITPSKFYEICTKVNQVIYSSAPISIPNIKVLAQIVF